MGCESGAVRYRADAQLPWWHGSTGRPCGCWFVAARKTLGLMLTPPHGVQKNEKSAVLDIRRPMRQRWRLVSGNRRRPCRILPESRGVTAMLALSQCAGAYRSEERRV